MRSLGIVILFTAALSTRFAFVCDDAFISFRYARNLARGAGLRFNLGEHVPVEGFSNLGWVLYAALFEGLLLRPEFWLPLTSAVLGAVGVVGVYSIGRRHLGLSEPMALGAAALLGWNPAWAMWSTGGLATVPFAVAVLLFFERVVLAERPSRGTVLVAGLLVMLLRIEGAAWVALILGLGAFEGPRHAERRWAAGWLVVAFVGYSVWRAWTFGTVLPHTALVKVGMGAERIDRGLRYVAVFALTFGSPLVIFAALPTLVRARWGRSIGGMLVATLAFGVLSGGDFLPMGRLLVVGLPFMALGLAVVLQQLSSRIGIVAGGAAMLVLIGVAVLPASGLSIAPRELLVALHFRYTDFAPMSEFDRWVRTKENQEGFAIRGRALADYADPSDSLVAPAVGAVGYESGLFIYDQHGLVTREVGLRAVPPGAPRRSPGHDKFVEASYFSEHRPTYLHSKIVHGRRSARRMRELVEKWDLPLALQSDYAPTYIEIYVPGRIERHFLVLMQRVEEGEDAGIQWTNFFEHTRRLAADL